ncbi:efflux RND transporter periplasmic adaptor subunit [Pantanalinema rosaneae CENA516]|uniref:efflux RND transporter periplasmic adaptor subunit n=1 Tax=Pantanalinema rosaneae TaxID=1620701 RepID=UPI003D6DE20B
MPDRDSSRNESNLDLSPRQERPSDRASTLLQERELETHLEIVERGAQPLQTTLKRYWWVIPIAAIVLTIGGITAVRLQENAREETTIATPTRLSVQTAIAQRQPIQAWTSSEGTVQAVKFQHLSFEEAGDVTYLAQRDGRRLRAGDRVRTGELLARIDARTLQADVQQAEANVAEVRQQQAAAGAEVAAAQQQVAQAQAQVQQTQAQVRQAQASLTLAQTEFQRYQLLFEQGVISASDLDTRRNAVQDAAANLQAVQAQVNAAQAQVRTAQAQVQSAQEQRIAAASRVTTAQAALSQTQVALEGTSIYAPFDGVIAYLNITEGEYFSPQIVTSQLAGNYQGILERIPMVIIDPAQFEVIVDLPGERAERVRSGQTAVVAAETASRNSSISTSASASDNLLANARARGEVFSVNPAISPGGRAVAARVRLQPETTQMLQHGERVTTWIATATDPNAVVVPLNTVVQRNQQSYVFVVNQAGTVEQRPVELGITGIDQQAIARGVNPGEAIVIQGQNQLVDGVPVQVVE